MGISNCVEDLYLLFLKYKQKTEVKYYDDICDIWFATGYSFRIVKDKGYIWRTY